MRHFTQTPTNFEVSDNYEENEKLQLWNKSFKISPFKTLNEDKNDDLKKRRKNENTLKTTNKGTFSLHIAAYENSTENPALDLFGDKNDVKKEKFRTIKTSEQCFTDCLKSRNSFEFPRQQSGDQRNEPEIVQYSASQQLLSSKSQTLSQQNGNNAEQFVQSQISPGAGTAVSFSL
uniref:Uncharacterized protein n=1 Tax=Panagrolaimus sp. PS1159 TaxID=55785 RepID=A0AC35GQ09_9BILA